MFNYSLTHNVSLHVEPKAMEPTDLVPKLWAN